MKRIKIMMVLIICAITIITMLLPLNMVEAAGNFSISKGSASLTTGETISISVTASDCAGQFTVSSSNSSVATVSTSSIWLDNSSTTITITAKSAGTASISIKAVDVTDTDLNDITGTKTCSITVSNPTPPPPTNTGSSSSGSSSSSSGSSNSGSSSSSSSKPSTGGSSSSNNKPTTGTTTTTKPKEEKKSNDATLKSLEIEGYELYPTFDTNTREYNIRVANDVTKVIVTPTVNHEKASFKIQGVEELLVGKNVVTIVVTAEDGSSSNYVINVTRDREGLNVEYIKFSYIDETGTKQELALNPEFSAEVFEYNLGTISHLISKLDVGVLANFAEANIEVEGNEQLVEGENTITVTVTMPSENEEEADEVLTYTIKLNKEAEPVVTVMGKIQNWFHDITGTVSIWFNENVYEILMGALILCSFALGGLSVYLVLAYKKYKLMLQKIGELTRLNNVEKINIVEKNKTDIPQMLEENKELEEKRKGRHF